MASTNVGHPISFLDNISIGKLDFVFYIEGGSDQTFSHQQDATWLLLYHILLQVNRITWHLHRYITMFWGFYVVHNGDKATTYSTTKGVPICLMISLDFE
jgi:hypothetical protein